MRIWITTFLKLLALAGLFSVTGCVIREGRGGDWDDHHWRGYGHEDHWDRDHWDRKGWSKQRRSEVPLQANHQKDRSAEVQLSASSGGVLIEFAEILELPSGEHRGFWYEPVSESRFPIEASRVSVAWPPPAAWRTRPEAVVESEKEKVLSTRPAAN